MLKNAQESKELGESGDGIEVKQETSPVIVDRQQHCIEGEQQDEEQQQQQQQAKSMKTKRDVRTVESGGESTTDRVTMKRPQRRFSVPETIMRR